MIIAVKNLVVERARLMFSVLGVGIAVLLVLVISGIFVGTTNRSLAQGRNVARSGEVVLDRVLASKNGIKLGDKVQIVDEDFTVVGLSNQTAALGNFYAFISLPDAARLLRAGNRVSYFLVQPRDGYTATQLAAAIHRDLPDMDALAAATFTDNSRAIIISMIGRPLKTMIAIAVLVG
ncbi:ABC transporter permease, partial [Mycobacterium kansasii]|uniref:ABC transporter permease n=1 Tax=Mycobacterium kansasii TaxID=1768 RepID=UPI001145B951